MEARSRFAGRYKKDMSIENLRTKIARRKSVTQKESRHEEFRKNRGLALVDGNAAAVKGHDLTALEEVNESYVEKVPGNKPAPPKAKEPIGTSRLAMLHRFKEERMLRKLKEEREKSSKGVFKCGAYKPDNPFVPTFQHAAKVKQKEKPAPPVVTRVTRSAAKAEARCTRSQAPRIPVPSTVIPKGRGQFSVLKSEKDKKVTALAAKTTKVTATTSRLPAIAKGQVKIPIASKPPKLEQKAKNPEQKASAENPEPALIDKANTAHLIPELAIKVPGCGTATEPESVPRKQKPSFAPENFEFQPLDGVSSFTFKPMTPGRANAFLTPSFTWSPVRKKHFVFPREHETEKIKQVSPPALTLKFPVVEQEMDMHASAAKTKAFETALPVSAMNLPVEVTLVKQDMDTNASRARDVALSVGTEAPPFDEIAHFPVKGQVKQEIDTETSPESRDSPALPVGETPPCDQMSSLPASISLQSEATLHDVPYFRGMLKSEIQRLTLLCSDWEKRIDMDIPEDAKDLVRTTVGQSRLLITERFKQFEGLVDNCEFKVGEKETTCTDLDGFWDMIYFQIEDVSKKFVNLEKLEGNSWQQALDQAKKVIRKKHPTTTVNKNLGDNGREAARSRLAAIKAALRNKVKQEDVATEVAVPENPVLRNTVVFDAGFFRIESPAKQPESLRTGTPSRSSGTPKSSKKVQNNSDSPVTCGDGESTEHFSQSPVKSLERKSLFSTEEESLNHENSIKTNPDCAKSKPVFDLSAYCVPNVRISEDVAKSLGCTGYFNPETGATSLQSGGMSQEEDAFTVQETSTVDDVFISPENVQKVKPSSPRTGTPEVLPDEDVKTADNPLDFLGSCTPDTVHRTGLKSEYVATLSDLIVFSPMEK